MQSATIGPTGASVYLHYSPACRTVWASIANSSGQAGAAPGPARHRHVGLLPRQAVEVVPDPPGEPGPDAVVEGDVDGPVRQRHILPPHPDNLGRGGRAFLAVAQAWPDGADVYAYFNNDPGGAAILDSA